MRVAITTDWLNSFGGAERVLIELHDLFPDAPIFTTVHDPRRLPESMQGWDVRSSFLQRIPFARRRHQWLLPLMPLAFEQFDMSDYDLVITTSSACAKGVITRPGTVNLCYCHTPSRYLWDQYHDYTRDHRARFAIGPVAHWLRVWDCFSADRVDHFVANSHEVSARIKRYYGREAEVIYPPVDIDRVMPSRRPPEDFYLVVSRLVGYKRVDLAIEAANRLGRRLLIVGDGAERARLESLAGPTVRFLGWLPDEEVADLYARCRGFLFGGLEDFGIAPVEAQAAGRPVVAYGRGGATETVIDGVTGVHFAEQTVESLIEGILQLERLNLDPTICRRNAERFDRSEFRRRLMRSIDRQLQLARSSKPAPQIEPEYMESA
jgi:glycosyltransferase involved in cell wall biosynthesis